MRKTRTTTLATVLALGLTLAACGGADDAADSPTADSSPSAVPAPAPTDEDATDDDRATDEDTDAGGSFDPTASGLAAVDVAETEAGGTAYQLDDEDGDGGWEVDVALEDRSVEVTVGPDSQVLGTEDDDLDDEDRAALDAATVPLAEAVQTAVAEVGGQLDGVELDDEDGTWVWEVSLDDTDGGDDVEVTVSTTTGEVVSADA